MIKQDTKFNNFSKKWCKYFPSSLKYSQRGYYASQPIEDIEEKEDMFIYEI